ncbi:hypothetical protein WA577_004433, partial [Blastocystis sp. JDR]
MNSIESKVVVIGPPDVGKTCLSIRFVRGRFNEHCSTTIGASFLMKTVTCGNVSNTMKIWDTAGQEVFRSMSALYYKDVDGAILVFDASNPDSMNSLDKWLAELKSNNIGREFAVMLACNKIDLAKTLNRDAVTRYAESIGAKAVFTSAKTGDGVTALFTSLSDSIVERRCAAASYAARSYGAEKPVSPSDAA